LRRAGVFGELWLPSDADGIEHSYNGWQTDTFGFECAKHNEVKTLESRISSAILSTGVQLPNQSFAQLEPPAALRAE
jgi:hypothetical protein